MHQSFTLLTVLFPPPEVKNQPSFNTKYTPEWADRVHRGVARNTSKAFNHICLTTFPQEAFKEDIQAVPFMMKDRIGSWMCINEIFREDLGVERGLVCGLDTIFCGPIDKLIDIPSDIVFPGAPKASPDWALPVNNGICIFSGTAQNRSIWDDYKKDPDTIDKQYTPTKWGKGNPSEMLYWIGKSQNSFANIEDYYPGSVVSYKLDILKSKNPSKAVDNASIIYFHGAIKNNHKSVLPCVSQHWV